MDGPNGGRGNPRRVWARLRAGSYRGLQLKGKQVGDLEIWTLPGKP